jgi:predicted permease
MRLLQDARFAIRLLARTPVFTAVVLLSLALGIGANTAIFSLINAMLLRIVPVRNPHELVLLSYSTPTRPSITFSYPLYEMFREHNHAFSGIVAIAGVQRLRMSVTGEPGGDRPEHIRTEQVSGNFFSVLGVQPVLGRVFSESDDDPSHPQPVVVLTGEFWQRRFGSDPGAVGRTIILDNVPFTIVGVAPVGFSGVQVGSKPELWRPIRTMALTSPQFVGSFAERQSWWLRLIARMKPGVSRDQARAEIDGLFQQMLGEIFASRGRTWTPTQQGNFFNRRIELRDGATGFSYLRDQFTKPLKILMFVVGMVLLIACSNVATLLVARSAAREGELSVRIALGAGRGRLIRQLLTESVLLSTCGGLLGIAFSHFGTRLLLSYLPEARGAMFLDVRPDLVVLGFTAGVSVLTGILFGLAPALRSTRMDIVPALKEGSRGTTPSRQRLRLDRILVVCQVALSLFLLIGSSLFVTSLRNLKSLDAGFDRENVLLFSIDTGPGYGAERRRNLYLQLLDKLESLPGTRSASLSNFPMLSNSSMSNNVSIPGYTPGVDEDMSCYFLEVSPHYFATMGIPLLAGRDFDRRDLQRQDPVEASAAAASARPRLAVISEGMARYFFRHEVPVGKLFQFNTRSPVTAKIIGVVKDVKYTALRDKSPRTYYLLYFENPGNFGGMTFEMRTAGDPLSASVAVRRIVQSIDSAARVLDVQTMEKVVNEHLMTDRFIAQLSGFFSVFALLLSSIGLYGIMSYGVSRRTGEIGIRMALGAIPAHVLWLVLKETIMVLAAGILVGVPAALVAGRTVSGFLYGIDASDPRVIAGSVAVLALVAGLAGYLPARRASRIDPMMALRCE